MSKKLLELRIEIAADHYSGDQLIGRQLIHRGRDKSYGNAAGETMR